MNNAWMLSIPAAAAVSMSPALVIEHTGYGAAAPCRLILRVAQASDRARVIHVINSIAAERRYFRTERYCPTPLWEAALDEGINCSKGVLLLVVEHGGAVVGFARLLAERDAAWEQPAADVGLGLLAPYRSQTLGTQMLGHLITLAPLLGFEMLTAAIFTHNTRSRHVFQKFQFKPVGIRTISVSFDAAPQAEILVARSVMTD